MLRSASNKAVGRQKEPVAAALPALAGPTLEAVLVSVIRQWIDDGHQGGDPRRHILPLVCKEWKQCLEGAPVWDEAFITEYDLSLLNGFYRAEARRATAWFEHGPGAAARSLTIDVAVPGWRRASRISDCENSASAVCAGVLRAVEPRLRHLSLRLGFGMSRATMAWERSFMYIPQHVTPWPQLQDLNLEVETNSPDTDYGAAHHVWLALSSLFRLPALRRVKITLRKIHMTSLHGDLALATQLEELEIRFCACKGAWPGYPFENMVPLLLPAPRGTLNLPPNLKVLKFINSPFTDARVLAQVQAQCPRLHRLALVRET